MTTLSELEKVDRDYLIPKEVAGVLHCMPYSINVAARDDPGSLGFPVIRVGKYVRIPKEAFLRFMRGG
jgi:hypothetical protein